jgi:hypothetical protein
MNDQAQGWDRRFRGPLIPRPYGAYEPKPRFRLGSKYPPDSGVWRYRLPEPVGRRMGLLVAGAVAVAPSGDGELSVASFSMVGRTAFVGVSGGQPRRLYVLNFEVTDVEGEIFDYPVLLDVMAVYPDDYPQSVVSPGPGSPVPWTFAHALNFSDPRNSMYL